MTIIETRTPEATPEAQAKDGKGLVKFGQPLLRREDDPILRGRARFTDDVPVPGSLYAEILRSPHAHARIRGVDAAAAKAAPGVVTVLSGLELAGDWPGSVPVLIKPDPAELLAPEWSPMATAKANYVGEPVAVVVAETRAQAIDALKLIDVDYEPLSAVVRLKDAVSDRVVIHEELGTNQAYTWDLSITPETVEAAFAEAAFTVKQRHVQQRLLPAPIETPPGRDPGPGSRGLHPLHLQPDGPPPAHPAGQPVGDGGAATARRCAQRRWGLRLQAADLPGGEHLPDPRPPARPPGPLGREPLRMRRGDDPRSRSLQDIEIAADANGKITAVRVELIGDLGAHCKLFTPGIPVLGGVYYHGCYDVPAYACKVIGVYTNLPPTDAYRGAGRPEATYAIERAVDELALKMGKDPAEIRRINFIPPFEDIHPTVCQVPFDSGNYEPAMNRALELVDYENLRIRQAKQRAAGGTKHLGVGIASYVEVCGYAPSRMMAAGGGKFSLYGNSIVRFLPTGKVIVTTGSHPHGQGHEPPGRRSPPIVSGSPTRTSKSCAMTPRSPSTAFSPGAPAPCRSKGRPSRSPATR